ncbi:DUF2867 domain-containing protein [Kitasatospora sp. NPDC094015]|uniref:DUF2867 domain-containing protein n=1 Tax=Kitasatospora sp. NPDC094015 TaxID=3155205 RepID=UPI00331CB307
MAHPARAVPIPADSLLHAALPRIDHRDAFAVRLPPGAGTDPVEWTRRLFTRPPGWTRRLMRLRDALVRPFGLGTRDRSSLTPFPQLATTDHEVVFGRDDRHLDFRSSVHLADGVLTLGTVVRYRNLLGRAYFLPVRPFHRRVVRALLRRAAAGGLNHPPRDRG